MKLKLQVKVTVTIIIILSIVSILYFASPKTKYENNGELIINEVIPNNKSTYANGDSEYLDIIELYNGYDYDVDLEGYYISDDNSNIRKFEFPSIVIKSKEYLLIYASGENYYEEELHTNFKLDNAGEAITLSDDNLNVLSRIKYDKTAPDTSYGFDGEKYVYFYIPTPGKENSNLKSTEPISIDEKSEYKINIVNNNTYIELVNEDENDINLEGFYLSDDISNIYKYSIPDFTLKSKEKINVYFDGLDKVDDNIHTNFALSTESRVIVFIDNKKRTIKKININNSSTNKEIRINEVSCFGTEAIELKNLTDKDITLTDYEISDNSGIKVSLKDVKISANSYAVLYGSDRYYVDSNVHIGFHINNSNEELILYKNGIEVDKFNSSRLIKGVSSGISDSLEKVFYKDITLNVDNSSNYYLGYSGQVDFSIDGGYVESGTEIKLSTNDDSTIYYTTDGSFPTSSSTKYTSPIKIYKTTTIKAISYKDNYLESDVISRTYFVGRKHTLPVVSISTDYSNLYGGNGIITNYRLNVEKMISFEYYETDGSLGISFVGDTKLSGMDSRERNQKSMSIYLRKDYGTKSISYPFFKDNITKTYSSFLLRNAGEDPKGVRIMDAALTQALKGKMDIDIQDYRPVVVYVNGEYYGMYNLREKLNSDYVVTNFDYDKDGINVIKYKTPTHGSISNYNDLVNYISNNNVQNEDVYNYIKDNLDIQELINYVIVEAYYGNTDLGNIRYWKAEENGKWRFMLYDLDWSLWDASRSFAYPINSQNIPAATYLGSVYTMTKKLYQNSEFRDLYLKTVAKSLKEIFNPDNINSIIDDLADEIRDEMAYHVSRWEDGPNSMTTWENNLEKFKNVVKYRYDTIVGRLKSEFNLSDSDYQKYFGDL